MEYQRMQQITQHKEEKSLRNAEGGSTIVGILPVHWIGKDKVNSMLYFTSAKALEPAGNVLMRSRCEGMVQYEISSTIPRQRNPVLQVCLRHWLAGTTPDPKVC